MELIDIDALQQQEEELEIPQNFPFFLPKGISWNKEIFESVKNYGLFMHSNQIYISRKAGKIENEDTGEMIDAFNFQSVSNFEIEFLQHIRDTERPMRLYRVCNIFNAQHIKEDQHNCFTTVGRFKETIEGIGNYHFQGTPADYEKLKSYLMDNMGTGRMISVLGWQHEGFFCFNNCAINGSKIEYTKYGSFEHQDQSYYVPSANEIYAQNQTKFQAQKLAEYQESETDFKTWCNQVVKVHRQHGFIGVTFGLACLFSDVIFKHGGFFPMIFLYGEASTGKSKLIESIQHLFGYPQKPLTITGKANTDKAKIRKFAQFNNMIVFLEEYRNSVPTDTIEMLKGLWNRYGYERGNLNSAYSTETIPISSGVMMTGNDYPNDDALLTRLIIDEMMKSEFSEAERLEYQKLVDMMNNGYSSIVGEVIQHRKEFEKQYRKTYQQDKKVISKHFKDLGIEDRMIENVTVLVATYTILSNSGLAFSFTKNEFISYMKTVMERQNNKRQVAGEISKFYECLLWAIREHKINYRDIEVKDGKLYLHTSRVYIEYRQAYYQVYRESAPSKSTLLDKIKRTNEYIESKKTRINGGGVTTSTIIDLSKLDSDLKNSILEAWERLNSK